MWFKCITSNFGSETGYNLPFSVLIGPWGVCTCFSPSPSRNPGGLFKSHKVTPKVFTLLAISPPILEQICTSCPALDNPLANS